MMKAETLVPMDLQLNVFNQGNWTERIWLTKDQLQVLEIVAKVLDQSVSRWLTETILSMLECELEDNVASQLEGNRIVRLEEGV
jgi:hypothetical protein